MKTAKPREQFIYIGCTEKFNSVTRSHDSFILPNDGKTYYIFHQREYPRGKKPKTIYALFQFFGSNSIKLNPIEELKKYDCIYAMDTNYKEIAVTTVFMASWLPAISVFQVRHVFSRSFVPSSSQPEREAWRDFIEDHNSDLGRRCCLTVDSELGMLTKFNRREMPIINGYLLPENWQLNYATSDVNDDFLAARMIRSCDQANKRFSLTKTIYHA